ncbi:hypothetical protein LCGC14_1633050 [marine sediment metagenome]|uniref:Band 7 domain-containing protein n=1 Tax=marine sediment metagenome TaxID=412755 RepID=A0A0F9L1Q3_9ZZZZ
MEAIRELFRQIGNLFRWWYLVAPWEQSVRVRLGKKVAVLGAGVHMRIPFIDRVFRQSTRRRFVMTGMQTISTTDGKAITIKSALGYEISDIGKLYNTLHDAEDTLESECMGIIAQFIASHSSEDVSPREAEEYVSTNLDLQRYGLGDTSFFITDFAIVRTYRLIQGQQREWRHGMPLNTALAEGEATQ